MKGTFAALSLIACAQALAIKKDTEIIAGVFLGVTQEQGLTNIDDCVVGSDRFTEEILHGVEMIVEFDLRSVISGGRSISRAIHQLPNDLYSCTHSASDVAHLLEWSVIFLEPNNLHQRIAANAVQNPARVSYDVLRARKNYKDQEWFRFGDDVGRLLAFLTQPVTDEQIQAILDQE